LGRIRIAWSHILPRLGTEARHARSSEGKHVVALRVRRCERISGLMARHLAVRILALHSEMRWLTCKVEREEKERSTSHQQRQGLIVKTVTADEHHSNRMLG
jgi:hypothetical protein